MPAAEHSISAPAPESAGRRGRGWKLLRQSLTQYDGSKVSVARGLRNALGVAVPLIVGAMMGRIEPALVMATGALNVGFADSTDPYLTRGRRLLAATLLVSLAVYCGALSGWTAAGALAAGAVWSFGAGLLVSLGTQIGNIGVTSICVLLIFASRPLGEREAALCGLLALGGGLFQTLLSVLPWPGRPYEPERVALASLYVSLGRLGGHAVASTEAPPATGNANAASAAIAARQGDHSLASVRYRALLDQGERIRACLVTLHALRARVERGEHPAQLPGLLEGFFGASSMVLDAVGETLRTGVPRVGQTAPIAEAERMLEAFRALPASGESGVLIADIQTQMDALTRQLRVTFDLANHATPSGSVAFARSEAARPWWLRGSGSLSTLRANLSLRSTAFRHAVRLAACVAAADALGRGLGWTRPYWLPLTVTVVLKPDFSSTLARGILRLSGTFAGLGIATALFHILPQSLPVEIGLIMAATFVLRWTGPAHYGVLALSVSELVVLLVALTGVAPEQVIMARARNTALGGGLALLAYWLWPTWERSQAGEIFARMLDAYGAHFEGIARAFSGDGPDSTETLDRTRSASRLARTNLEASVDRLAAEPATAPEERDRWEAMLASSHIFAHSIIMLHASLLAAPESLRTLGRNRAFLEFVEHITRTLAALAAVLRGADPRSVAFPDLREVHYRLVHSGEPMAAPHTLISVEADKMVNSLNTLREQVLRGAAGRGNPSNAKTFSARAGPVQRA
jgi:uncharacterized membrane protein YccC